MQVIEEFPKMWNEYFVKRNFSAATSCINAFDGLNEGSKLHTLESIIQFAVNVSVLDKNCIESPEFELHNITWKIETCFKHDLLDPSKTALDVSLITPFSDDTVNWHSETQAQFKLLHKSNEKPIVQNIKKHNFNQIESTYKIENFVTKDDLLEQYVVNDEAVFEITISRKQ